MDVSLVNVTINLLRKPSALGKICSRTNCDHSGDLFSLKLVQISWIIWSCWDSFLAETEFLGGHLWATVGKGKILAKKGREIRPWEW